MRSEPGPSQRTPWPRSTTGSASCRRSAEKVVLRTIGVAIAIPEPWGGELQRRRRAYGDALADAIPTHITLLPPTEVSDEVLRTIEDHLLGVADSETGFELHLRGTGTFRPVSPVVFVQVARGISDLERLEHNVRCGPLGRDLTFPFHPHVTVAHDLSEGVLDLAFEELADYEARFAVWGFSLFEHGPDAVWRPQRDYVLGQALPGPDLPSAQGGPSVLPAEWTWSDHHAGVGAGEPGEG